MILTSGMKTPEMFTAIETISMRSFQGPECPPLGILRNNFDRCTVFVDSYPPYADFGIYGFAITVLQPHPHLWSMAVDPYFRGLGKGGDLLREITQHYRGLNQDRITLNCRTDNPAQKLYFDQGYRAIRVTRNYYGDKDGLLMNLNLKS